MKNKKICIVGLGYVGLPFLCLISKKKFSAFGYDIDKVKIRNLKKNISHISDIKNKELKGINKKNLLSQSEIKKLSIMDYIIICLPTPLTKSGAPDLSFIKKFLKTSFKYLRKNQTIILESTVPPSTTENIFLKKLHKKFKVGKNFYLCFSPERINPGSNHFRIENITKVISGFSKNCTNSILKLYKNIFKKIHIAENIKVAELSKIYENTFRSVNISLANEMKIITSKLKINIHDVIKASSTKEFGFTPFYPGPGVGGHCIPVDPIFLKWIGKQFNTNTEFISLANKINNKISRWILGKVNFNLKLNTKILVIGISYKKNINDIRMSPALFFLKYYLKSKRKVDYYDPYVPKVEIAKKTLFSLKKISKKILKKYDKIILLSDHDCINYNMLQKNSKKIYDTRGRFAGKKYNNVEAC